ncbi:MAG: protein-L-isoaspartate(D-aspartate) O-methyltransferase [Myxococcota bacterium]|jgi:protein-L-isoaspartate(D-aspartate) O-methyltransferase
MVARLLREGRIEDWTVLAAFLRVPRAAFAPPERAREAHGSEAIELSWGQTLTCPDFVAMMVTAARVKRGDRVLEVGTGTGYQAAVLAACGAEVVSIEIRPQLHEVARDNHATLRRRHRADLRLGDGALGAPDRAPFDAIILGCAAEPLPPALIEQLAPGGRVVYPEGDGRQDQLQTLVVIEKTSSGLSRRTLRAAWFVPLVRPDELAE